MNIASLKWVDWQFRRGMFMNINYLVWRKRRSFKGVAGWWLLRFVCRAAVPPSPLVMEPAST